jgi:anti-sigma factor RsiW
MKVKTHPVSGEELMAYLDGELPAAQALAIAGHLADCASCRALASEFERLGERLREWSVESPPDELRSNNSSNAGREPA